MRFLIAFAAVLGFAAASVPVPLVYGINAGDAQAAAIDATVAVQDHVRAVGEGQARAAEAVILSNTEAARQVAETARDIHENTYWNGVAASQNYVAAAQSQAAAINGAAAAVRAAHLAAPLGVAPLPLAYGAHLGVPAVYGGLGVHGLGYRAW